jgi:hypothetical protein
MKSVRPSIITLRRVALLALAAFAVHQLRYLLGYGGQSGEALSEQGHGYLATALPVVVGLSVLLLAASIAARALRPLRFGSVHALGEWLICSLALLAVFACQELAEGAISAHHPAGVSALVAGNGWLAVPLAATLGVSVVWCLRLLERADAAIAQLVLLADRFPHRAPSVVAAPPLVVLRKLSTQALVFGFGRRPPPLTS